MKLIPFLLIVLFGLNACAADTQDLSIVNADGSRHIFHVELANTPDTLKNGLMFRTSLDKDHGMLFDFGTPQQVTMWMKNTYIPLDMLFIRADGTIARIAKRTEPHSLEMIPSVEPVTAVLEIPAGVTDELGIQTTSNVIHPLFQ